VLAALAFPLVLLVTVAAGTGWLYLLRSWHVLGGGPHVPGALELERLAAADAQPLGRLVAAWLPAGLVAGLVLSVLVPARGTVLALAAGAGALVVLLVLGAASNAIENSEPIGRHLAEQPGRAGPWCAAVLVVIGAYLGARAPGARRGPAARASSAL
jgi:sulfite exporter TauE/SafE